MTEDFDEPLIFAGGAIIGVGAIMLGRAIMERLRRLYDKNREVCI